MQWRKRKVKFLGPPSHNTKDCGRYFVTAVVSPRRPILAEVVRGELKTLPAGKCFLREVENGRRHNPIVIDAITINVDHVHLCMRVIASLNKSVLQIIENWLYYSSLSAQEQGIGLRWLEGSYVFAAVNEKIYQEKCDYIEDNERRIRLESDPSLFCKPHTVEHPLLDPEFEWNCTGDHFLLEDPLIYPVHIHKEEENSPAVLQRVLDEARQVAAVDGVIAGGFVSKAEKWVIHTLLSEFPDAKVIHFSPKPVNTFHPTHKLIKYYAERRWLEITSLRRWSKESISYGICRRHNLMAEALGRRCKQMLIACLGGVVPKALE